MLKQREDALAGVPAEGEKNPYFAPTGMVRAQRKFHFVKEGSIARKADKLRTKAFQEMVQAQIEAGEFQFDEEEHEQAKISMELPPDIEWWDADIALDNKCMSSNISTVTPNASTAIVTLSDAVSNFIVKFKNEVVNAYVHHPILTIPPCEKPIPPPRPLMLTKAERRKMRTKRRLEAEKLRQDEVRLGIRAIPKNRVKLSNLVRVLGTEATLDPTKIEATVKDEMEKRRQAHEARYVTRVMALTT